MYFLDAIDDYNNHKPEEFLSSEYEVLCRVHLTGVIDFGFMYMQFWEIPPDAEKYKNKYDVRAVYLKTLTLKTDVEKESKETEAEKESEKKEEYYFPGGFPGEIVTLLTLFTRTHFVLSRSIRSGNILIMQKFADEVDVARGQTDGKQLVLGDLMQYFSMFQGLRNLEIYGKKKRLEAFMFAARFYYLGYSLIEKDSTIAYLAFVSSIEALLHDYDVDKFTLEEWNENATKLIRNSMNEEQCEELRRAVITKPIKIKRRFISFVKEHLTDKYWADSTRPTEEWLRFKDLSEIEMYLKRIYDARSLAVHSGEVFPPTFGKMNEERPLGLGIKSGTKEWIEKELIPPVRTFERMVHHVLMEYLIKQSKIGFDSLKK